jgi:hypothetical protein
MSKDGVQIEISVEDRVTRQAAQATLDIANREIDRINVEIGKLMARRTAQEGIAAEARAVLISPTGPGEPPPGKEHLAQNYVQPGPGWRWVQSDPAKGGYWEKDGERRYPIIYAESEG